MSFNLSKISLFLLISLTINANTLDDASGEKLPQKQIGSLELKTADTVLSLGGRIQMDAYYGWPEGSHSAKSIPVTKVAGENGQLLMNSKESRIWLKTRTPSKYGPIRTLIETDFVGSAGTETNTNSNNLRVRHAFFQVNNWTIGQTNSAFNAHVTLDNLNIAINDTLVRQPLIRYGHDGRVYSYYISFEQPETTLLDSSGEIITPKDDVIPDIVLRARYYPKWGEAGISLMLRYITQNHASLSDGTKLSNKDSAFGVSANISTKVKVYRLNDIRFALHYGEGLGRYLSYGAYADGSIDNKGNIKLHTSYGGNIGYRHHWSKTLRSTLSFSIAKTDNKLAAISDLSKLGNVNKKASSSQINLLWTPISNSLVGVEYARATREVESLDSGDIDILLLRFRYDF